MVVAQAYPDGHEESASLQRGTQTPGGVPEFE
jgi:hypothetical protein